jgi:hypothetical protein
MHDPAPSNVKQAPGELACIEAVTPVLDDDARCSAQAKLAFGSSHAAYLEMRYALSSAMLRYVWKNTSGR